MTRVELGEVLETKVPEFTQFGCLDEMDPSLIENCQREALDLVPHGLWEALAYVARATSVLALEDWDVSPAAESFQLTAEFTRVKQHLSELRGLQALFLEKILKGSQQ